jgi:hypothetical protein
MVLICANSAAAYLVVFLPPTKAPTRLFPNDDPFGPEPEFAAHEVFTLADVHAVPLSSERATSQVKHLGSMMVRGKLTVISFPHSRTITGQAQAKGEAKACVASKARPHGVQDGSEPFVHYAVAGRAVRGRGER